jgi:hypothetical protein
MNVCDQFLYAPSSKVILKEHFMIDLCRASQRRINNPFSDVKYGARLLNKFGINIFLLSKRLLDEEIIKWKLKLDFQTS